MVVVGRKHSFVIREHPRSRISTRRGYKGIPDLGHGAIENRKSRAALEGVKRQARLDKEVVARCNVVPELKKEAKYWDFDFGTIFGTLSGA